MNHPDPRDGQVHARRPALGGLATRIRRVLLGDCTGEVAAVAITAAGVILALCFLVPRQPGMEEAGVFNAVYTYAHFGKMSFPVYGPSFYDSFGIHPHLHYAILGLLIRSGLSLYAAEGVTIGAASSIAILVIARSAFPDTAKVGFIMGLGASIVLSVMYMSDDAIGVRPELHASIAWLAGLVALESSRLERWPRPKLCAGTFLLTYAAATQNYMLVAPLGLVVYSFWMSVTVRRRRLLRTLGACCVAGCVVGIPFLLLYLAPNWSMVRANVNWGTTHSAPVAAKAAAYFAVYDPVHLPMYRRDLMSGFLANPALVAALTLRIPLFVAAAVLLALRPVTRGMAIAALPVTALAAWVRPEAQYFISEQTLYLASFWSAVLAAIAHLARQPPRVLVPPFSWGISGISCAALFLGSPPLRSIRAAAMPLHEMDVARAAGRQIVGPRSVVGSRHLAWYIAGGAAWYRVEGDLMEPAALVHFDGRAYASQFDAIADYGLFSDQSTTGTTPSSLYVDGSVHLKGFYLAQRMPGLSLLFFQATPPDRVKGYFLRDDRLYQFMEERGGPWVFATVEGDATQLPAAPDVILSPDILSVPGTPHRKISAMLLPRSTYVTQRTAWEATFRLLNAITGEVSPVDAAALVRDSRASDRSIHFLRAPEEPVLLDFRRSPELRPGACGQTTTALVHPVAAISSGHYATGFEAESAFDGTGAGWASARLGSTVRFATYIGADFNDAGPQEIRAVRIQQSADPSSGIRSAVLMSSADRYHWNPVARLALSTGDIPADFCVPRAGAQRFWKLVATDDPQPNHAWSVKSLGFYR